MKTADVVAILQTAEGAKVVTAPDARFPMHCEYRLHAPQFAKGRKLSSVTWLAVQRAVKLSKTQTGDKTYEYRIA